MATTDIKLSDLTALGAQPSTDDLIYIVDQSEAIDADKSKYVTYGNLLSLIDEDDMVSDTVSRAPTQQSVKAYVDTQVSLVPQTRPSAVRVYATTDTWTKPTGLVCVIVKAVGGGGGGGGTAATGVDSSAIGGGGGGGGYSESLLMSTDLGATELIAVGAGGAGGSAGANNGSTGGNSSFGSLVLAYGGNGGAGSAGSTGSAGYDGGTGGSIGTGDITIPGSQGGYGHVAKGAPNMRSYGGQSFMGGMAVNTVLNSDGSAGRAYGGGGSGASSGASQSARPGGAGANGVVIVYEYVSS